MKRLILLAALAATGPAHAAILTYAVSGTFSNGQVLSGQFTVDTAGASPTQLSDYSFAVGPATFGTLNSVSYTPPDNGTGNYALLFTNGVANQRFLLTIVASHEGSAIRGIEVGALGPTSSYTFNGFQTFALRFGSIAAVNDGVPEPAAWAMLLAGFGLVGGALRHARLGRKPVRVPVV